MNKKYIIMIFCIVILIIAIALINTKDRNTINMKHTDEISEEAEVKYDEETGLYYIRDEETNEIIAASREETDLEFYKKHPDYKLNSDEVRSKDLKDFVEYVMKTPSD